MGMAVAQQLVNLDPWYTLGYQAETLAHYLQRPDVSRHTYQVWAADQTAGVVCCRYPWLRGPFLELLAIYPLFQGRGLGREILGWLENHATCRNLWTTVSAFNTRALNFYTTFGFAEIGCLKDLVRDGFDEILLRKIIQKKRAGHISPHKP